MGGGDPCLRIDAANRLRFAIDSPAGPAAVMLRHEGESVQAEICGDGGEWMLPHLPALLGLDYQPPQIEGPRKLRAIARRYAGMRIPTLPSISLRLVQIVIQQLISYRDACTGWRQLVRRYGEPVPDQADLWFPPAPRVLRRLASSQFIECGVLPQHGRRIVASMRHASKLESLWNGGTSLGSVDRTCDLLRRIHGIGPWTIGFLRGAGLGDADAEVLGDYGHAKQVGHFFRGLKDADDQEMLRLLEPYRPHRFYVLTLLTKGAPVPPRRGPRHESLRTVSTLGPGQMALLE